MTTIQSPGTLVGVPSWASLPRTAALAFVGTGLQADHLVISNGPSCPNAASSLLDWKKFFLTWMIFCFLPSADKIKRTVGGSPLLIRI